MKASGVVTAIPVWVCLLAGTAGGEQTNVRRFDVYAGYAWFDSPAVNLTEHGIQLQGGVRVTTWLSLGFDYTNVSGDLTLTGALLTPALQDQLRALLGRLAAAGQLPPNYSLLVPSESKTQTFAGGPQFAYRRWERVTLFIRPSCGLIREVATPQPGDPIAKAVVSQLAPEGKKIDWTPFYGVGGGLDLNFTHLFSLRVQADFVYDHLFPDTLAEGRRTVRFSIGPAFNLGRNIAGR